MSQIKFFIIDSNKNWLEISTIWLAANQLQRITMLELKRMSRDKRIWRDIILSLTISNSKAWKKTWMIRYISHDCQKRPLPFHCPMKTHKSCLLIICMLLNTSLLFWFRIYTKPSNKTLQECKTAQTICLFVF